MKTIKLDIRDFAGNTNEINEQIACEFGKVNLVVQVLNEAERNEIQLKEMSRVIDLNNMKIKVNGKTIYKAGK